MLPSLKGPVFITGEPRRDYTFLFRLSAPDGSTLSGSSPFWTKVLFSDLFLTYISGLAEKVTIAPEKFEAAPVQFSLLQFPFPKGFAVGNLSVQYLEDELESVFKFHYIWQNNIRGTGADGKQGGGLQFTELGKVCCKATYAPSKKIPMPPVFPPQLNSNDSIGSVLMSPPVEVPLGGEIFPHIFPVQIDRAPGDRGGNNIAKTTVTYVRVPKIEEGTYSEWNYKDTSASAGRKYGSNSYDAVRVT